MPIQKQVSSEYGAQQHALLLSQRVWRCRQMDDDHSREACCLRRVTFYTAQRAGARHQLQNAHASAPFNGTGKLCHTYSPSGRPSQSRLQANAIGTQSGSYFLRNLDLGRAESRRGRARTHCVRRESSFLSLEIEGPDDVLDALLTTVEPSTRFCRLSS